jgi:glutathione-independent formaldehyde dehydrogenase
MVILHDKVHIARGSTLPRQSHQKMPHAGYAELDSGAATKYVLNPDGYVAA